jgi:hypothetical protein
MLTQAPAAATWAARFPEMRNVSGDRRCQPAHNSIVDNTYCKCGKFIDASASDTAAWGTTVARNTEVGC